MKKEYKVGETVLIKKFLSNPFHADIIAIKHGIFGKIYYAKWGTRNLDYDPPRFYQETGRFREWNIID